MIETVAKKKGDVYLGTYLPEHFINEFNRYVKTKNIGEIRNVTKRELIYEALKEKMLKDGFEITEEKEK